MAAAGLVDTHAHLDYFEPKELPGVLSRAREAGVGRIVTIGTDLSSSRRSIEIASKDSSIYAAVGIHPHDAAGLGDDSWRELSELAQAPKVVAVGETGLDYYRMRSPKEAQIDAFKRHITLAGAAGLPLVVHCRDAYADLLSILGAGRPPKIILHCFSGGPAEVETFLELGCHISFSGNVTFSSASNLREAAALVPMDRLLLETDCPYLTPHPHRGERNEPGYVKLVAQKIAEVKTVTIEEVIKETAANADKLLCL